MGGVVAAVGPRARSPESAKKVVLVNLPYFDRLYGGRWRRLFAHYLPSLTLASLAAAILDKTAVQVIDAPPTGGRRGRDEIDPIAEQIERARPDLVGFTSTTPMFPAAASLAERIGECLPHALLVCGGYHPSALPEASLAESRFDVAVVGEGEWTLRALVERLDPRADPAAREESLSSIPGLVFRGADGAARATGRRAPEANLDRLPMPAFQLLGIEGRRWNRLYHMRAPVAVLEASRGCPFRCGFCSKSVHGQSHRTKSPARVVEEVRHGAGLGFREVYFVDDSFLTNRGRAALLCSALAQAGLDMPWSCHARIDEPDSKLLAEMRRAGCHSIAYGIESPEPALQDVRAKTRSVAFMKEQVARTRKAGIRAMGMFILGLPEEDEGSLERTVDLGARLGLDSAKWTVAVPFPGTPMHEDLARRGAIRSRSWELYRLHGDPDLVFRHPRIGDGVIRRAYERAYLRFYARPGFAARSLARWTTERVRTARRARARARPAARR